MFITKNQIETLKKNFNVSKDAEKTKDRVQSDFKVATKKERDAVIDLSGQSINSIYRIYTTGSINARILLALAQTLNAQPQYYTGEVDERLPISIEQIKEFLKSQGYDALSKEIGKAARSKHEKNPPSNVASITETTIAVDPVNEEEPLSTTISTTKNEALVCQSSDAIPSDGCNTDKTTADTEAKKEVRLVFSDEPQMEKAVEELTEQEAIELLHTLFIRAKAGGEAATIADVVKRCLLK